MKILTIVAVLLLSACSPDYQPMTNDEIIAEVKKCESAGLDAERFSKGIDYKTYRIECRPKGKK